MQQAPQMQLHMSPTCFELNPIGAKPYELRLVKVIKQHFGDLFWVCFFLHFVLPERLANELPEIVKILKCLDLIDCIMVLPISICKHTRLISTTPDFF